MQRTDDIAAWLTKAIASALDLDPGAVDPREPFAFYGLDSRRATALSGELSMAVRRPVPVVSFWEHPTIEALARHLGGERAPITAGQAQQPAPPESEPIAIVGMACRLPGAASLEAFWRLLRDGVDAVTDVPPERWDTAAVYAPDPRAPGKANSRRGGFLDRIDGFDPLFFGISPREAALMDPQQRLVLELAWEALEDAGLRVDLLAGSATGVFVGAIWCDYAALIARAGALAIGQHTVTGHHASILANRVSYVLGLNGPSMTIDSACSSALTAVHLACESLRRGESTVALAGGVNLNLIPESTIEVAKLGALSPDGRCFTFDARANGYVRGEGAGMIVLKPLSRAIADGDPIRCVIRGSAVNNDGRSSGLTAPNPAAQEALLRAAYERAGVRPEEVQYVEAHGTGTQLGDPIEAKALGAVLGRGRPAARPLRVGSAKTNVGHLEGAAGIVGLIKVALSIEHRMLPPSLHFERPNPHIPFEDLRLAVQRELGPWPEPDRPLVAGVSSFGLGGTNAHIVVREWRGPEARIVALSAADEGSLRARLDEVAAAPEAFFALSADPSALEGTGAHRLAVVARSAADLARRLAKLGRGEPTAGASFGAPSTGAVPGVVFVFSGQGAQWPTMAQSLLEEPVFRSTIERCGRHIRDELGWSLVDELTASPERSRLDRIEVSLPAIIAVEIAVAALWRSWGVEPAAVVGHSTGEIAAAHVAGAIDLADAMRTICAYGRIISQLRGRGAMGIVCLSWERVQSALGGHEGRLFRAIQHDVGSTVVAGEPDALDDLFRTLEAEGVFCRRVEIDVAPHCPLVNGLREELFEALRGVRPRPCKVPIVSEVTGTALPGEAFDAAHWVQNFADSALFSSAVDRLLAEGHHVFVDVGPHPVTKHAIEANLRAAGRQGTVLASLRRGEDGREVMLGALGALYTAGLDVRWDEVHRKGPSQSAREAPVLLPLSAKSPDALAALANAHAAGSSLLADVAYTAATRRTDHDHRLAIVAGSREELADAALAVARGQAHPGVAQGRVEHGARPQVVLVFPGQGSQWAGMGRELLAEEPVFREAIEAANEAVFREAGWSLIEQLASDEAGLDRTAVVQPVLFAIEVALAALWRSWGIAPDAVVGHSMGEIAAAHVAGALSLEDAVSIIVRRSALLERVAGRGAMALIDLPLSDAERAIRGLEDRISIAVSNGPRSTVVSGETSTVGELIAKLERDRIFCRRVNVAVASHSPQMDPLLGELRGALGGIIPRPVRARMWSTVTGELCEGSELGADYWAHNLRHPVLFGPVVRRILDGGPAVFVEASPHPILVPSIDLAISSGGRGAALGSLRRGQGGRRALLESLGALYARGVAIDWEGVHRSGGRVVSLPAYPWQRQRCWIEAPASPARAPVERTPPHPLLGAAVTTAEPVAMAGGGARRWEQARCLESAPWLADHRVGGQVVFPGAGYLEMALAAAREAMGPGCGVSPPGSSTSLVDVVFERAFQPAVEGDESLQLTLVDDGKGEASFEVVSRRGERSIRHAAGRVRRHTDESRPPHRVDGLLPSHRVDGLLPSHRVDGLLPSHRVDGLLPSHRIDGVDAIRRRCPARLTTEDLGRRFRARGIEHGPRFQGVVELWAGAAEIVARVRLPEPIADSDVCRIHPVLLDACFQAAGALLADSRDRYVPVRVDSLVVRGILGREVWVHATRRSSGATFDVDLIEEDGTVVAEVRGLALARVVTDDDPRDEWLLASEWRHRPLTESGARGVPRAGAWLIFADRGGTASALEALLRSRGDVCVHVEAGEIHERTASRSYRIPPGDAEAYRAVIRDAFDGSLPCRGVVHLFGLDATGTGEATPKTLDADQDRVCLSALWTAQALLRSGARELPRLWLVTRGAGAVPGEAGPVSVSQAPLRGFVRTLALEHPELGCAWVDLSPTPFDGEIEALRRELDADDGEEQIALRPAGRLVARLARGALAAEGRAAPVSNSRGPLRGHAAVVRSEGTYLITGGLGGLGLRLAQWLVAEGARHLALVGRSSPGTEAATVIADLERAGAEVLALRADVSRSDEVAAILKAIGASLPTLRGVVHAAAVLDDRTIFGLTADAVRRVMAPKVLGAWNLHRATAHLPLDAFVLYSSAAALLGSPGQAHYAAANAFLDALAHHRRREGLVATSVQWGAFSEVGLAAADDRRGARLAKRGIASLTPAEGLDVLRGIIERPPTEIGVLKLDVGRWLESHPGAARSPFFGDLRAAEHATRPRERRASDLAHALRTAAPAARLAMVRERATEDLRVVLRLGAGPVDEHTPFKALGLDSLMSLELRNRLEHAFGIELSATVPFTHPTLASLAEHLLERMGLADAPPEPASPSESAPDAPIRKRAEPIALIGMGCRFPGGADTPEAFWQILEGRVDAVAEVPADRWTLDPADTAGTPSERAQRWGAFLRDVDRFDARFFGISPREAATLDPQQRLLLEVAWEALERAGLPPDALRGSGAGVFVGMMNDDYAEVCAGSGDVYAATGNGHAFAAGRLSYALGLTGPSVVVQTACSSSLVAVHLACQSLRLGETDLAIAGGVSLMLSPSTTELTARTGALSPSGTCRAFDALADGFVRGEGCGVVVLKRLSDALAAGDPIVAILRGSAVNQDGRSAGLTVPSARSQQAVVRAALENAGVQACSIGYVETHGTGTPLGDPIEIEALAGAIGAPRADGSRCALGAVKTNIGHLEAAAGVAGLVKAALCLERAAIPPNLHFRALNPRIALDGTPLFVPAEIVPWPVGDAPRFAAVSSFGMSGTNAHVVLEEAPRHPARTSGARPSAWVLPISARCPGALSTLARAYRDHLVETSARVEDVVHTAAARRSHYENRLAIVGSTREELVAGLDAFARGDASPGVVQGAARPGTQQRGVVMVFSGQGSQWAGMARGLCALDRVFLAEMQACDALVKSLAGWSVLEAIAEPKERSRLNDTCVAQPAIFAIQAALTALWRSWGVSPSAVIGHSLGEVAAAYAAGALSLEQAVRLVVVRGSIAQRAAGGGRMLAVEAPREDVARELREFEGRAVVAAVNDPRSVVLSGDPPGIEGIASRLRARGLPCRMVRGDYAFHSPQMDPIRTELVGALRELHASRPGLPMYSTVTGARIDGARLDADYWGRNIREPVALGAAVDAAIRDGYALFLEVGPHPVLVENLRQCLAARETDGAAVGSLRRAQDEGRALAESLAAMYARGIAVDFRRAHSAGGRVVPLPTYPWQRQRHWVDATPREQPVDAARREQPVDAARREQPVDAPGLAARPRGAERASLPQEDLAPPELAPDRAQKPSLRRAVQGAAREERRGLVERRVAEEVARVLHMDPIAIDRLAHWDTLGMDSLTIVELRNRLEPAIGARLPIAEMLVHASVTALSERLLERLVEDRSPEEPARPSAIVAGEAPDRVLLSGATGFLGTYVLRALLSQTRAEVRCLVRADDDRSARERLDACVRTSGVGEIDWRRVVPVVGDLSRPGLGLSEAAFRELGRGVSAIYHNGAMLDFVRPYEGLEPTNVGGTRDMLRVQELSGGAPLHYVSSIGVLPEGHPALAGLAEVAASEEGRTLIHGGYCRSKRVAEQLVVRAGALGAPVVVYRPGLISGHSRTGAWKIDDAICKIIKGTIQAGVAPDIDWRMALVPVDFVADALVHLSTRSAYKSRFFHLVGPESVRWSDLVNRLRRRGYAIAWKPYAEWLDALASPTAAGAPNEAACLLPWLRADCPMLDVAYDASSARAALAGSSIACPPVDEAMLDRYLDALVSAGFLAAPGRRKDGEAGFAGLTRGVTRASPDVRLSRD